MFVNDRQEYTIGTSECRLSSEHCEGTLNSRERSDSVCLFKPCHISSRAGRIHKGFLGLSDTHYRFAVRDSFILAIAKPQFFKAIIRFISEAKDFSVFSLKKR
jgi:hypothetical protein